MCKTFFLIGIELPGQAYWVKGTLIKTKTLDEKFICLDSQFEKFGLRANKVKADTRFRGAATPLLFVVN